MEQIPDFWRTEVYHPLFVHFPIGLLLTAFLFKIIALKYSRELWEMGGNVLLFLGTIGLWIAVYTGDRAGAAVTRGLCDPTILKDHENFGYYAGYLFSAALVLELLRLSKNAILVRKSFLLKILSIILLALGAATLTYVGHLGATLVYQQGAGVYHPSEDCSEFE
ncbi:MAG TPA: DUF2231 domain-containing protein [Salinimicrobium sp.]|nr:DUF2231 domain-containing protein [Salinimicrobium sp.]